MPESNFKAELYDFHHKRIEFWVKHFKQYPAEAAGWFEVTPSDVKRTIETEKGKFNCSEDIMAAAIGYAYRDWLRAIKNNSE